jgi:hypothetical protein
MHELSKQVLESIKELSKRTEANEQKVLAETIKHLCESMGLFFDAAGMMAKSSSEFMDELFEDDHE